MQINAAKGAIASGYASSEAGRRYSGITTEHLVGGVPGPLPAGKVEAGPELSQAAVNALASSFTARNGTRWVSLETWARLDPATRGELLINGIGLQGHGLKSTGTPWGDYKAGFPEAPAPGAFAFVRMFPAENPQAIYSVVYAALQESDPATYAHVTREMQAGRIKHIFDPTLPAVLDQFHPDYAAAQEVIKIGHALEERQAELARAYERLENSPEKEVERLENEPLNLDGPNEEQGTGAAEAGGSGQQAKTD